jgi:ligand-binding sensor domain-containing protein
MKVDYNAYEGIEVTGMPDTVLLRGKIVVRDQKHVGAIADGASFAVRRAPRGLPTAFVPERTRVIQAAGVLLLGLLPLLERARVPSPGPAIRRIGLEEGLSDTHLRSIIQDRDGFLWFGTADGLNRYDGYQIRIFAHDPKDPRSLGSSFVSTLTLDRSGNLWVGTRAHSRPFGRARTPARCPDDEGAIR